MWVCAAFFVEGGAFELLPLLLLLLQPLLLLLLLLLLGLLLPLPSPWLLLSPPLFLLLTPAFVAALWWPSPSDVLATCPKRSEKKDEKTPTIVPFTCGDKHEYDEDR